MANNVKKQGKDTGQCGKVASRDTQDLQKQNLFNVFPSVFFCFCFGLPLSIPCFGFRRIASWRMLLLVNVTFSFGFSVGWFRTSLGSCFICFMISSPSPGHAVRFSRVPK